MLKNNKHYDFSKFNLFESYGIINFNDIKFYNFLKEISKDIIDNKGELTNIYFENELILQLYQLKYKLDWCDNLYVYYDINSDNVDSYVLSRPRFSTDKINELFLQDNLKLKNGAIVIINNNRITNYELISILKHEIKHLYYYLKTNISTDNSNKDILYQESYMYYDFEFDFNTVLKLYYNHKFELELLDENTFSDLLVSSLYYLNLNECRAMLENIDYEIKTHIQDKYLYLTAQFNSKYNKLDIHKNYILVLSETYAVYMFLYNMFNIFKLNNVYKEVYNTNFLQDFKSIYNVNSFEQFCNLMINRIQIEILNKSYKIYTQYFNEIKTN